MVVGPFDSRFVNRDFRIKVYGWGLDTLLGFSGLRYLLNDDDLFCRLLDRAYSSRFDVVHCRLRRGLKVSFYYK